MTAQITPHTPKTTEKPRFFTRRNVVSWILLTTALIINPQSLLQTISAILIAVAVVIALLPLQNKI